MRALVFLCIGLAGCSLMNSKKGSDRPSLPDIDAYFEATLNGQPWRPDTIIAWWYIVDYVDNPENLKELQIQAIQRSPTIDLPFYYTSLNVILIRPNISIGRKYYLFYDPIFYELNTERLFSNNGAFYENDGDAGISSFVILMKDSLSNWIRLTRLDTLHNHLYVIEGNFNLKLFPWFYDPVWSKYPKDTLNFAGKFRLLATNPQ